jgi:hypothetical protein
MKEAKIDRVKRLPASLSLSDDEQANSSLRAGLQVAAIRNAVIH